jgi:hypothetical protein
MSNQEAYENVVNRIKAANALRALELESQGLPNTTSHWLDDHIESYWNMRNDLESKIYS